LKHHCQLDLKASDPILLIMSVDSAQIALERVLAAVGQCLDRQSAESLLRLPADTEMQGRIEEPADKCTEGELTPEEGDEYEAWFNARFQSALPIADGGFSGKNTAERIARLLAIKDR
jgi:hypothetical protein